MRTPTLPEQLVAALALLFVAGAVIAWLVPDRPWLLVLFGVLGVGLGAWLAVAIRMLRLQHRVAAAYNARIHKLRLQIIERSKHP